MTNTPMPHGKVRRILIVDDDPMIVRQLRHTRDKMGLRDALILDDAEDIDRAIRRINEQCYDAVTIDVILPGVSGVQLACLIRQHDGLVPLAYLTYMDTDDIRVLAMKNRAYFLTKGRFFTRPQEGCETLLRILQEMAELNPCKNTKRMDDRGHERLMSATPIEMPASLSRLLEDSKRLDLINRMIT